MSKMSKAIAVLGVVAGLGVAALPLSTYAADPTPYIQTATSQVKVEVGGAISIDVENVEGSDAFKAGVLDLGQINMNQDIASESLAVTVSSNAAQAYTLSINSQTSETAMKSTNGGSIPANKDLAKGTAGWAYKVGDGGNWTAITAIPEVILDSGMTAEITPAPAEGEKTHNQTTKVTFGVAADSSTPEGIYTNTVVFTATVK